MGERVRVYVRVRECVKRRLLSHESCSQLVTIIFVMCLLAYAWVLVEPFACAWSISLFYGRAARHASFPLQPQ